MDRRRCWCGLVVLLALAAPAWALPPEPPEDDGALPGQTRIDAEGRGIWSRADEVPPFELLDVPPEIGVFDRAYLHARRLAEQSDFVAPLPPEALDADSTLRSMLMRHNGPRAESVVRSALGAAAAEEVLGRPFDPTLMRPADPSIGEPYQPPAGLDTRLSAGLHGVGVGATLNLGGPWIDAGFSSATRRLDTLRLNLPFSGDDHRGNVSVDSQGVVWLQFLGRW